MSVSIGLPQEGLTLKRLNNEQAKLFNMKQGYLNIGAFIDNSLAGFFSIGNFKGVMHLYTFHNIYYGLPFIARRMAKFVQSFIKASKCGFAIMRFNRKAFKVDKLKGQELSYFKNYGKIQEYNSNDNIMQFLLIPKET